METDRIRAAIIDVTSQIQTQSQREMPSVCGETRLIGDIPGFDSLNAVELVILLSDALDDDYPNCNIPDRIILGAGKNARPTLDEVVESVHQYLTAPRRKSKEQIVATIRETYNQNSKEKCDAHAEI